MAIIKWWVNVPGLSCSTVDRILQIVVVGRLREVVKLFEERGKVGRRPHYDYTEVVAHNRLSYSWKNVSALPKTMENP